MMETPRIINIPKTSNSKESQDKLNGAKNIANELHKPIIRKFERRKVIAFYVDEIWSCDLCEMPVYENYKYILTIIDVYSKYGWAIPLTNKRSSTVTEIFKNLIENSKRKPQYIWSDQGSEFRNKEFETFCSSNEIKTYETYSELKAVVVERFNRTLKERMYKEFTVQKLLNKNELKNDWPEILKKIVFDYNRSYHSTIKMSPIEAINPENVEKLQKHWLSHLSIKPGKNEKSTFQEGDFVRIYRYKSHFEKGYKPNWTDEIFKIKRVIHTSPVTYNIEDKDGEEIIGGFYKNELQKCYCSDVGKN